MKPEHTISWSIQPHKKSINFAIFKHPGSGIAPTPKLPSSTFEAPPTPSLRPDDSSQEQTSTQNGSSIAIEKLTGIGLKLVSWHGLCEANQVSSGLYAVPKTEGGMYALVFDNTFAKQFSKTATFVLLTYPTDSAPLSSHHVHHVQGSLTSGCSAPSLRKTRPKLGSEHRNSSDSVPTVGSPPHVLNSKCTSSGGPGPNGSITGSHFYTGILQKRRRKKHQGYARRFFSLDFASSTLTYYHNRHTLALRGAVPLSLAAIGANGKTREISIDSGAEVWHLKALNQKDFTAWKHALELASRASISQSLPDDQRPDSVGLQYSAPRSNVEDEREWSKVEALVNRVAESRDDVRRLAKDTDPKYLSVNTSSSALGRSMDSIRLQSTSSTEESPIEAGVTDERPQLNDRRSFWKRKPSNGVPPPRPFKRSVSAQPSLSSANSMSIPTERAMSTVVRNQQLPTFPEENLHEHCMKILKDLDAVVGDFSVLLAESKQRRTTVLLPISSRRSWDTQGDEEFFDAESGDASQLFTIHAETDEEGEQTSRDSTANEEDSASASEDEEAEKLELSTVVDATNSAFPTKPKSLTPLPLQSVKRRTTVPIPTVSPPSQISLLRKNAGKDWSTISMPASLNEPLSLLQRQCEQMEYSDLLDAASGQSSSVERLLHVAAFAISSLSSARVKERANRKPFNPMLGETFELVREDRGYRFFAEKVSHRPVRIASQAESEKWSFAQSFVPISKFWGKSAEVVNEGRARVTLHTNGEHYSWNSAKCFLRNMIAGEKYVEPVETMTIINETTGEKAVASFKSKGMFSGRSEDVIVQTYDTFGDELSLGLVGKWTQSLTITDKGVSRPKSLWTVNELALDASKRYGLTAFASSLNEITPHENSQVAPTDSRLRPDQRAAEDGDFEKAEDLKMRLEEGQRERRKTMEERGEEWTSMWFTKVEDVEGEEVWGLKSGKDGYWEERVNGEWKGALKIFDV